MKFFIKFISAILVIIFVFWGIPMIKCEYLTARHGSEFDLVAIPEEDTMLSKPDWFRILSYNDEYAEIYYISEGFRLGSILSFNKVHSEWKYDGCANTRWTLLGGSADEIVWPYFWHMWNHEKYKRFELNKEESFFSNFYVKGDKAYIECEVVIDSVIDFDIKMQGFSKLDEGKLLKHPAIYGYDKEGTPIPLKALAREYGTSRGEKKKPFFRKAFRQESAITNAMKKAQEKYIK